MKSINILVFSVFYGLSSVAMIFINKLILNEAKKSKIEYLNPEILLFIQCLVTVVGIIIGNMFYRLNIYISISDFYVVMISNLAFLGTMLSNSYTLHFLSIHMVTLLKCLSVVITAVGEVAFYGARFNSTIWFSIFLIVLGSSVGLYTDLEFSLPGYLWMLASISFSACYVLTKKQLLSKKGIGFFAVAFWNNLISSILLFLYSFRKIHLRDLCDSNNKSIYLKPFFLIFSGLAAVVLDVMAFLLLSSTTATSYVIVGIAKKVVQAAASFIIFPSTISISNVTSVTIGLAGASLYAYEKYLEQKKEPKDTDHLLK